MATLFQTSKTVDFVVLVLRWYLAYYMIDYGIGKIIGEQFGLYDPTLLDKPLREVSKFKLAWYLFGLSNTFNIVVGVSQILGGVLLIINRTALIGALVLLPILMNIFLIDLCFATEVFGSALTVRLVCMIFSALLILRYYRERILKAWAVLTTGLNTRYRYPWWVFLLLPLIGLSVDFVWAVIAMPVRLLIDWLAK